MNNFVDIDKYWHNVSKRLKRIKNFINKNCCWKLENITVDIIDRGWDSLQNGQLHRFELNFQKKPHYPRNYLFAPLLSYFQRTNRK